MQLEPVIGLEIHVQLKTDSKMFCACPNIFGDVPPNTAVCPICLGHPGTLPVPNQTAIEWIYKAGAALNCELAKLSKFDRKHYFYPDLPKGYQISQYDQPFCTSGKLEVMVDGELLPVRIHRIHLEEDAAKNTHPTGAKHSLVDYNRAGTPLIEIVTEPDIASPAHAKAFLQELQKIIRTLGISDADMEKGQMRCDANISLRPVGDSALYPKTEIKNVNSFRFVEKALQYEITRQTTLWEQGQTPSHATRGFNSDKGITTEQRTKEAAADYRYFPEPDIPPFEFTDEDIARFIADLPELPGQRRERFAGQYGLPETLAAQLVANKEVAYLFEDTVSEIKQIDNEQVDISPNTIPDLIIIAAKICLREVRDIMTKNNLTYQHLNISANNLAEVVIMVQQGHLNSNAILPLLTAMQNTGGEPEPLIEKLGLKQVSDTNELEQWVDQVIIENPDAVAKIKGGNEATLQFLMGQVMAKSRGQANPPKVLELLRQKILN